MPKHELRGRVSVTIDNPDAHHARGACQAKIVVPLADTLRRRAYSAHDLEGHVWTFGTYRPAIGESSVGTTELRA
jgi:hypothetical protein